MDLPLGPIWPQFGIILQAMDEKQCSPAAVKGS